MKNKDEKKNKMKKIKQSLDVETESPSSFHRPFPPSISLSLSYSVIAGDRRTALFSSQFSQRQDFAWDRKQREVRDNLQRSTMESSSLKKEGRERSEKDGSQNSMGSSGDERSIFEFFGWVYHLGVNSIGHEFCHLRFLFIRGKYVEMYKRDPHENPDIVSYSSFCSTFFL